MKNVAARCLIPGCPGEGKGVMCAPHWALVPADLRRELVAAVKQLADRGQRKPSPRLQALFTETVKTMQKTVAALPPRDCCDRWPDCEHATAAAITGAL